MDSISMNSWNSKTSHPKRLLLNLSIFTQWNKFKEKLKGKGKYIKLKAKN